MTPEALAALFDHTLLRPEADARAIAALCADAAACGFRTVCVNPVWVPLAVGELSGTRVGVCSVAGFPLGATRAKPAEAARAVAEGASEIDMVGATGLLKSGDVSGYRDDIAGVVSAVAGRPVKVIIETCLLTEDEKVLACRLCEEAGAAFVKTSTGFSRGGATPADVALIARTVGGRLGVKASGGITTLDRALEMLAAGATRLGSSSSLEILSEMRLRAAGGVSQPPAMPPARCRRRSRS